MRKFYGMMRLSAAIMIMLSLRQPFGAVLIRDNIDFITAESTGHEASGGLQDNQIPADTQEQGSGDSGGDTIADSDTGSDIPFNDETAIDDGFIDEGVIDDGFIDDDLIDDSLIDDGFIDDELIDDGFINNGVINNGIIRDEQNDYLPPYADIVYDYTDLNNALSNDNGITAVYFGRDIEMQDGIKINPAKESVTISGINPLDPGQTQPYTLTEYNSASFTDTIYIDENPSGAGTKSVVICDLAITGKNYYGPVSVLDSPALAGVTLTYDRVYYDGPQLGYNRRGTVCFRDSRAVIHSGNGVSPGQEFSEVKRLLFEGVSAIDIDSNLNTVFWHPLGGSFTIADAASLTLNSPNTSSAYGMFYADGTIYRIDISIGRGAAFRAAISSIVAPELYSTINSLTVREGGEFYLKTTKNPPGTVLRMGGALTVEKNAKFIISGFGGLLYEVIRQDAGDIILEQDSVFHIAANSPYAALINLVGRALICNDPRSVLLYNANRDISASGTAGRIFLEAQQVNYWNGLSPGGFESPPLRKWRKADGDELWIDGKLSIGAAGNFVNISGNCTPEDSPYPPDASTFSMRDARVLSWGRLNLMVAELTSGSTSVGGITAPGAAVRVSVTQHGSERVFPDVTADGNGGFNVPIDITLDSTAIVKVMSSLDYLYETAETGISDGGRLSIYVPEVLEFYKTELSSSDRVIARLNPDWRIIVADTREIRGKWRIYACLNNEITAAPHIPALKDALIFAVPNQETIKMNAGSDILIYTHETETDEDITSVTWNTENGILLLIKPGEAYAGETYGGVVRWTIVDGV